MVVKLLEVSLSHYLNNQGNNIQIITLAVTLLSASITLADKPEWAGHGKPSKHEKEHHKHEMKHKHEHKKDKHHKKHDHDNHHEEIHHDSHNTNHQNNHYKTSYEGKGQSTSEFIDTKVDETKKNWISKAFDFFN